MKEGEGYIPGFSGELTAVGKMVSSTASCSETPGMVIDQQVKTICTCGLRIQVHDGPFIVSLRCELPGSQWLSPERLMNYKLSSVKSHISHQDPNHFALPELKSSPMDLSKPASQSCTPKISCILME